MMPHDEAPEHEFEAEHGLPQPLPRGETMLWQGSPDWRLLARDAMHTRMLALYFAALLILRGATALAHGGSSIEAVEAMLWLLPLPLAAIATLAFLAWLIARTSVYSVTDKRVVMRIGVVLSITFNLPYTRIDAAAVRLNADGSGDVTLLLDTADRIAYAHLWPHARPWHLKRTQPMLRALPQARAVAALLSKALADANGVARGALPPAAEAPSTLPARPGPQPLAA